MPTPSDEQLLERADAATSLDAISFYEVSSEGLRAVFEAGVAAGRAEQREADAVIAESRIVWSATVSTGDGIREVEYGWPTYETEGKAIAAAIRAQGTEPE